MSELTRKQFIGGAAAVGAASVLSASAEAAVADEAQACLYADTLPWDGRYDVVVCGFGAAGACAAVYAAEEGANVLLFDVADEWQAGGNSRYCAQYIKSGEPGKENREKLIRFYQQTYGETPCSQDVIEAMVDGLQNNRQYVVDAFGANPDEIMTMKYNEFSEYEGGDAITGFFVRPTTGDASAYLLYRKGVYDRADKIDVWYNARGMHLVQDPVSKDILGIEIEKDGETRRIRADRGVVLTCGGFEANPEMMSYYLNLPVCRPIGGAYNRGDSVRMGQEVGAKLWHMGNHESFGNACQGLDIEDYVCVHARDVLASPNIGILPGNIELYGATPYGITDGSWIFVGPDGNRFEDETGPSRHGHKYHCGEWKMLLMPSHAWMVMDNAHFQNYQEKFHPAVFDIMVQADTVEELAEAIGAPNLPKTVAEFNECVGYGVDYGFGRDIEKMAALTEPPFYAIPHVPRILNTQGGPKRNGKAEVLDTNENVINHLFSAGELGSFVGHDYEGGSNFSECLVFGRIAGMSAAAASPDTLRSVEGVPVESDYKYTIGSGSTEGNEPRSYDLAENQYLVTTSGMGGDIDVIVTLDGDAIVSVEVPFQHESMGIGSLAVQQIPAAIVEAQSPEVDVVASATVTSYRIRQAVADAIAQAKA